MHFLKGHKVGPQLKMLIPFLKSLLVFDTQNMFAIDTNVVIEDELLSFKIPFLLSFIFLFEAVYQIVKSLLFFPHTNNIKHCLIYYTVSIY